jgi:hypothetical protein
MVDDLEEMGIIVTYNDKINSRDEHVVLDESHIFMQVFDELKLVENIFEELSKKNFR